MSGGKTRTIRTASTAVFAVLALLLVFNFADQSLQSPLLDPLLADFFGRTADIVPLGWVTFVFTLCAAAATIAAGLLAGRGSRLRLCLAGSLTYGAIAVLSVLIPHGRTGYAVFFLARALAGFGIGLIVPSVFALASDLVAADRRSTALGVLSVAMLAGRLAGFAAGGAFAANWRTAYALIGAINLALAAALASLREPPRGIREPELREAILAGAVYRFRWTRKDAGALRAAPSNLWLIFNFVDVIPGSIILFLIFKYMKDVHNMDAAAVNAAITGVFAAGAAGAIVFGRVGDLWFRRDRRAKVWTALLCNAVPALFMIPFLTSRVWIPDGAGVGETFAVPGAVGLAAWIAAAVFINQGVNPNWYGTLTDVNLPEHRAAMISFASVMDMAGNALGPLCASYLATRFGLRTAMAAVLAFWIFNVFLWLPILSRVRRDLDRVHAILSGRAAAMNARPKDGV
ncbi:MAG: MFS transporter [Acidobacteria bacterium]|nr:MFS transporter [Acidobacteriota bacterium]